MVKRIDLNLVPVGKDFESMANTNEYSFIGKLILV
jgi:hypothetical protein